MSGSGGISRGHRSSGRKELFCAFGIDVDAVAGWLGSYGGEDSPCDISRGLFSGEVGEQAQESRVPAVAASRIPRGAATMTIDRTVFMMAFGRDVDFHDACPQSTYLDRRTGEIVWLYEDDDDAFGEVGIPAEENREGRERVAAEPERYLEITGLDHGDHHEILRQFLRSDWTDDDVLRRRAEEAYSGSIGRWKRDVCDEGAVHAFYAFQEERIAKLADAFLRENGIVPKWR